MNLKLIVLNVVLFQVGWFACVLSAANGTPLYGALAAALILFVHLLMSSKFILELALLLIAMIIGTVWDSILVHFSLIRYEYGTLIVGTAPYWIIMMWALFASTLNISLHWLKDNMLVAFILGAISGPLAYYGGSRLGALEFKDATLALLALSIGWALFTPLLVKLSKTLDGFAPKKKSRI